MEYVSIYPKDMKETPTNVCVLMVRTFFQLIKTICAQLTQKICFSSFSIQATLAKIVNSNQIHATHPNV